MDINLLQELAYKKMGKIRSHLEREPGHIFYHGLRVAKLSVNLRKLILPEETNIDDIIFTGALFHDIGKGIEPHAETGYAVVKHILPEYCESEELIKISEIVRYHCKRVFPNDYPFWIRIVQDADILDHMGTTEIWLNFLYNAYEDKSIDKTLEWYSGEESKRLSERMRNLLNYNESKEIWDEKTGFVDLFVKRLAIEADGGLVFRTGETYS